MSEYYSEERVAGLFDELIEVWADWQASMSAWSEWHSQNAYPRQPEGVLDVSSLAEYRRAVSEHEQNRQRVDAQHGSHNRRYEGVTTRAKEMLPKDSTIEHEYGGDNASLAGRYRITHDIMEHQGIRIEKIET